MNTQTASLYMSDNGEISCINHGGLYLKSSYTKAPERRSYRTPAGTWEQMDSSYCDEWANMMGSAPTCGSCR